MSATEGLEAIVVAGRSYPVHPAAGFFPLLEGGELWDLATSIKSDGLLHPVVLCGGAVLDGRNRLRACEIAGVEPLTVEWKGSGDPSSWVTAQNLVRRHMSISQRAIVGAKLLAYQRELARERMAAGGGDKKSGQATVPDPIVAAGQARDHVARQVHVSPRTVEHAATVVEEGVPELVEKVRRGEVAVSTAAEVAKAPPAEQREIVARSEKEIVAAAKEIRARRTEERRTERMETLAEIAKGGAPLTGKVGRHPIVLADPPWRYQHAESESRAIENQYPTMATLDICALTEREDFPAIQDDAVLFLWATAPKLREALAVMDAWGFEYRTNAVWVKAQLGMGYWFRNRHELLLVGRRGRFSPPTEDRRPGSVFDAPRAGHSVKPENVRQAIESMFPDVARVELFARERTEGWAVWGNQA